MKRRTFPIFFARTTIVLCLAAATALAVPKPPEPPKPPKPPKPPQPPQCNDNAAALQLQAQAAAHQLLARQSNAAQQQHLLAAHAAASQQHLLLQAAATAAHAHLLAVHEAAAAHAAHNQEEAKAQLLQQAAKPDPQPPATPRWIPGYIDNTGPVTSIQPPTALH